MGIFDAINIFSKGITTMAINANDANATRAAQAGKTVTTSDGYQITYDDNGFGRKSVGPDGATQYYDSLGNQTKIPWNGPAATSQPSTGVVDTAGIAEVAKAQGGVQSDPATEAAIARIEANRSLPNPQQTPQEAVAAVSAEQNRINSQSNVPASDSASYSSNSAPAAGPAVSSPSAVSTAQQSAAEQAATPLSEPTQVVVPPSAPIPTVQTDAAPKAVDPAEDPFEASRVQAQAAANAPAPTEQDVIKASDDPQLTKEQLAKQAEQQEYNRAKLKMEETEAPPGTYTASSVDSARSAQTIAVARNTIRKDDWRVRLSLAPGAKYLYNLAEPKDILFPVKITDGVIFPYSPTIQTAYRANYDATDITHSNYKMYFYKNSNVDEIQLTADFTAQDTTEANYLLAVIHFFKSVTKMFYGQDGTNGPKAGTPPPLLYLNGYGQYQFNEHPVLITSFTYNLPNDVDYIRAGEVTTPPGSNKNAYTNSENSTKKGFDLMKWVRTSASNLLGKKKGKASTSPEPKWVNYANQEATYVPTKMQIQLSMIPIVTRNDISRNFSLEKYAKGDLLKGRSRPTGGGIW